MRVIGIDPGSYTTGYGVVDREGNRFLRSRSGCIRAGRSQPVIERLEQIHAGLREVLEREKPDAVAVETPFLAKSVHSTLVLGQVRGVVLLAVRQAGLPLHEYAPREVKSAVVGNGAASKEQVQFMVTRLLALSEALSPDAADALAVAICHHQRSRALKVG